MWGLEFATVFTKLILPPLNSTAHFVAMVGSSLLSVRLVDAQTVRSAFQALQSSNQQLSRPWTTNVHLAMAGARYFMYVFYTALLGFLMDSIIIQGLFNGNEPLFPNGMEIASSAIGAHGARIRTSPIAIVELILEKLPAVGTPAQVLFSYLQASFASNPDDLKFLRCSFNIDSGNLGPHQKRMSEIATALKK